MQNSQKACSVYKPMTFPEARKGMEAVAEHINEMQKIYEEYGSIFDELAKMFKDLYPQKKVEFYESFSLSLSPSSPPPHAH